MVLFHVVHRVVWVIDETTDDALTTCFQHMSFDLPPHILSESYLKIFLSDYFVKKVTLMINVDNFSLTVSSITSESL